MAATLDTPKVFISYSWKPTTNKEKTISLAERLSADGVHVILDIWDLKEGQDKFEFMEQMVVNPEVKRVLLICNKDYADKANNRQGGVGHESLIISKSIYDQTGQEKFIPIIFERDENGKEYLPVFIQSRIYIDLSSENGYEDAYDALLRNLFNRPSNKRPVIGTPPAHLLEDSPIFLRTAHKITAVKNALVNEKKNYQIYINDYYSTFLGAIEDFIIPIEDVKEPNKVDEIVYKKIGEIKILRDDFIKFLDVLLTYSYEFNLERFLQFFEDIVGVMFKLQMKFYSRNYLGDLIVDHFRFFLNELIIYVCRIMIDKEKYKELGVLLHHQFVVYDENDGQTKSFNFVAFRLPAYSIEKIRKDRLMSRSVSLTADLIKERVPGPEYSFDKLKECDIILYFVSLIQQADNSGQRYKFWFPITTSYSSYYYPFFQKMESKRFFEKVKVVFGVNNVEELKEKVQKVVAKSLGYIERWEFETPYLDRIFDFNKIGTIG